MIKLRLLILSASFLVCCMYCLDLEASFDKADPISNKSHKVLHLTFHKGCMNEFNGVAEALGIDLETWFIPDLPPKSFDGTSQGNVLYNIGHDRAERIWNIHKENFEKFDAILTSDTAPLSRIFLQNNFKKPLIIWVCNRFDYSDQASVDCEFPDPEFYHLFNQAQQMENVKVIAYTPFEHYYAKLKGIDTGSLIISPCVPRANTTFVNSSIPSNIVKADTFFLPPYHNENFFMDLSKHCTEIGIPNYCGRYNGSTDLKEFKGIIHLPYSWSTLALFENIALGIPYFIPSPTFLKTLVQKGNYFHPNLSSLIDEELFDLSEWYMPERHNIIIYFDSWGDLKDKIETTDYEKQRDKIKTWAQEYKTIMLSRWKQVFENLQTNEKENP